MECAWQVERDLFCRKVLAKNWPDVPKYKDIRKVDWNGVEHVDLVAGGFPCPVVSQAARNRNNGEWLWPEFARCIRELRPRWVLLENVTGLLYRGRGFGDILGDLAELRFNAEWKVLPASAFGAPHHRARVWLVGYSNRDCEPDFTFDDEVAGVPELRESVRDWPNPPRGLRVGDGIPHRMDRTRALGNAVVPQVAEAIGRMIVASLTS